MADVTLLHVITALNVGGAETMLARLVAQGAPSIDQRILSLMTPGPAGERIAAGGTPIDTLSIHRRLASPTRALNLMRLARHRRPDLIMGWMHHGHIASWLAARAVSPAPPLIWNVRHSLDDIRNEKWTTQQVMRLGAVLSKRPAAIIYNSHAARTQYEALGYSPRHALVIPNGFDCDKYRPDPAAPRRLRGLFGIDEDAVVVGMVARAHPMKDPGNLVEAVRRARSDGADIHLLIVGQGMASADAAHARAMASGLPPDRYTLVDGRADVAAWLGGLDILALPSAWGEGFPNIVGEAMACGVPCIATDVGESRSIIAETGLVVPPRDPDALARALVQLVDAGSEARRRLGQAARGRIIERYALHDVAARYVELYRDVLAHHGPAPTRGLPGQKGVPA
ncbi:glycosyltransferase [Sphingomonas cavernae]|uniref:Glycosyltransferase n=1 Tax=Sphingomonas cavernae TaxID=2320861 RepID=A0A418WQX2_9SPHN|nr:glycosyltransferase [Sphingomonas cavernae]RJF93642.1 glycosyltransferase [Sphingomonas cavernae]